MGFIHLLSNLSQVVRNRSRWNRSLRSQRRYTFEFLDARLVLDTAGFTTVITESYVQTPFDKVPRFGNIANAGAPIVTNLASGTWSNTAIWPDGRIPGSDARVQIADGTHVVYDVLSNVRLDTIEVHGSLDFATSKDTRLFINELMVMPGAHLTIGTAATPVNPGVTSEIVFRSDTALKTGTVQNPGIDPQQYGKGLLVYGDVTMRGQTKDLPFDRLAEELHVGDSSIELVTAPSGWRIGDRLIVPDTRQIVLTHPINSFTSEAEEVVISSIEGNRVTLTKPLAHNHLGPRDALGNIGLTERSMLPHIGNLTRNIVLRSENPNDITRRGHTVYFDRANVDLNNVAFVGLGRTSAGISLGIDNTTFDTNGAVTHIGLNQVGRYSLHLHHVWGPENPNNSGYQGQVVGNVVEDFQKWGIALHDTHYFLIQKNVAYGGRGSNVTEYSGSAAAAIATEDGNEAYNVIEQNFVVHTKAGDSQKILGSPAASFGGLYHGQDVSRDGFWFRGQYNYVRDNVVANAPDFAYNYNGWQRSDVLKTPKVRGANMLDPDQYDAWNPGGVPFDGTSRPEGLPMLESARNEAYGAVGDGLWLGYSQGHFSLAKYSKQISTLSDWRIWHVTHAGVYDWGQTSNEKYVGFVLRNDPTISGRSSGGASSVSNGDAANSGFAFGDTYYAVGNLVVRNFDVQGFNVGIVLPHRPADYISSTPDVATFENGVLKNHINIEDRYLRFTTDKRSVIRDVVFALVAAPAESAIPAEPLNIWMNPDNRDPHTLLMNLSKTFVYNFNREEGRNFQVFFEEQAPAALIPSYRVNRGSLPQVGAACYWESLTNEQCWDKYGIAVAGAVAPSKAIDGDSTGEAAKIRAAGLNIHGLVFPIIAESPPPSASPTLSILQPAPSSTVASTTVDVRYSKSGDPAGTAQIVLQLDDGAPIRDADADGQFTFANVAAGDHTLRGYLTRADGAKIGGSDVSVSFATKTPRPDPINPSVAYWSFDEGMGTVAGDSTGNGNDAALRNGATWAAGKFKSGVQFDGVDDYLDAGNVGHANQLTVAAWVNRRADGGATIVTKTQTQWEWELQYGSNGYAYFVVNGINTGSFIGVPSGQWTHLAATYDGAAIRLYRDGALVSSKDYSGPINDYGYSVGIGRRVSGSSGPSFGGVIDDVHIENRAFSADEIKTLANATPTTHLALLSYWTLDESTGNTAADSSGKGNAATLENGAAWAPGRIGNGVQLDGFDDYLRAGNIGHSNEITVAAWVKRGLTGGPTIVTKTQAQWEWELQYGSNGYAYFVVNGTNTGAYIGVPNGSWVHLAATYDRSAIKLYKDGVLVSSKPYTADVNDFGYSVGIGRRVSGWNGASLGGAVDDVRVYQQALTAGAVSQLFSSAPVSTLLSSAKLGVGALAEGESESSPWSWTNNRRFQDVTNDGIVNLQDLIMLVQFLRERESVVDLALSDPPFAPSVLVDIDRDRRATLADVLAVVDALRTTDEEHEALAFSDISQSGKAASPNLVTASGGQ